MNLFGYRDHLFQIRTTKKFLRVEHNTEYWQTRYELWADFEDKVLHVWFGSEPSLAEIKSKCDVAVDAQDARQGSHAF